MSGNQASGDGGNGDKNHVTAKKTAKKRNPSAAATRNSDPRNRKNDKAKKPNRLDSTKIFTGVLAFAAIVTIAVLIAPQRADLRFYGAVIGAMAPSQPAWINYSVLNDGGIAAHVNQSCHQFVVGKLPTIPIYSNCQYGSYVVPAEKETFTYFIMNGPGKPRLFVSPLQEMDVRSGKATAYYFGRVSYRDRYDWILNPFELFGVHDLHWCRQYDPANDWWSDCNLPGYSD